jgi:hypothetical protein
LQFSVILDYKWEIDSPIPFGASQGYIIRILKHFATKLWNITNFVMLSQAVLKFLSRLV